MCRTLGRHNSTTIEFERTLVPKNRYQPSQKGRRAAKWSTHAFQATCRVSVLTPARGVTDSWAANPKHTNKPYRMSALASKLVGVSLRISRNHESGICSATMTPNQYCGASFQPSKMSSAVDKFCGTKMRYVRQTPLCMRAMPVLTRDSPVVPKAR